MEFAFQFSSKETNQLNQSVLERRIKIGCTKMSNAILVPIQYKIRSSSMENVMPIKTFHATNVATENATDKA